MGKFLYSYRFIICLMLFAWAFQIIAQEPPLKPSVAPGIPQITNLQPLQPGFNSNFQQGIKPNALGMTSTNRFGLSMTNRFRVQNKTNEFQKFVYESVSEYLPMYGQKLFTPRMGGFSPVDNLPVTADYVVGPGDQLIIRAWGQVDINLELTVDRNGAINIPQVGVLQVAGLKANQIEGFVKTAIERLFKDFELNVSFGRLRSIKVLIVGHVENPGNYTVSSLSTALSALFEAGGPSSVGSMRKIEVRRGNQSVSELDLYDLLIEGDNSKDIRLLHGDIIRVLPVGPLIALSGSVQTPAIYELKDKETIEQVIELSGGLTATASKGRVSLERIQDRTRREVISLELNEAGLQTLVQNGDLISIEPISPKFDQVVSLRGHVDLPRRYKWNDGMRLNDLIPNTSYLIPRDYWMRVNQLSEKKSSLDGHRAMQNQAKDPTELARVLLNEINWQYATITRLNPTTLRNELITFNLAAAIRENDPEENYILRPGDMVTIYSQKDVPVPKSLKDSLITLRGEIANPGIHRIKYGETLSQLIQRVGGFTSDAYPYASVFTRESVRIDQQKRLEEGIARMEKELAQSTVKLQARSLDEGVKASIMGQMEAKARSISTLRSTSVTGRITLNLEQNISLPQFLPRIELKDGDTFFVPSKFNEVHVMGEVFNQQSTIWNEGDLILDTLAAAGGPTRHADMKQLFLIRANGTVISYGQLGRQFIKTPMHPGDTLVVPEQIDFSNWKYELKEWAKIFSDFAVGVAAIRVLGGD